MSDLAQLTELIVAFRDQREWKQFHTPKDLAAGLAIEAAELQELFLWKREEEMPGLLASKKQAISEELADVAWFVLLMANDLDINMSEAIRQKLQLNSQKYPIDKAKGSSKKYDELT